MQVDRKKLKTDKQYTPDWQTSAGAGAEEEYEAPSSALEEKIQKVWQEVLGQEKISVAADFFQIGGNSLRVSHRVHRSLPILRLPLPEGHPLSSLAASSCVGSFKQDEDAAGDIAGMRMQVGMVMAKVRAAIDGDAPTALFFKAPTISGLARQIEALSATAAQAAPIPHATYTAEQLAQGIPCWPLQKNLLSEV